MDVIHQSLTTLATTRSGQTPHRFLTDYIGNEYASRLDLSYPWVIGVFFALINIVISYCVFSLGSLIVLLTSATSNHFPNISDLLGASYVLRYPLCQHYHIKLPKRLQRVRQRALMHALDASRTLTSSFRLVNA